MKLNSLKKTIAVSTLGVVTLLGISGTANAQRRGNQNQPQKVEKKQEKDYKQPQKVDKKQDRVNTQQRRVQQQRAELERQRGIQRQEQIRLEQQRQAQIRNQRNRNDDHSNNRNNNQINNRRYRVYRNGSYYQTDYRGAELLRQAVNSGYQQGFEAGQYDRSHRRNNGYYNSSVYCNGNYGYESYVEQSQYQYYFQKGFEKGYEDGYNSRNQYGSYNNGNRNILTTILSGILNLQEF
jgi:hypothetical protein